MPTISQALVIAFAALCVSCSDGGEADTAAGSTGAAQPCFTCKELLGGNAGQNSFACDGAADQAFGDFVGCACGDCRDECLDTLCQNVPPTDACRSCFMASCSAQIDACNAN
jgi:hypothetical protein